MGAAGEDDLAGLIALDASDLSFERDGAALHEAALTGDDVAGLRERLEPAIDGRPGRRLPGGDAATAALLAAGGKVGAIAAGLIGRDARPVRAVLFDKTAQANWIVAWHQDRTIAVRERIEMPGFGPWSTKAGILHVAPPVSVLEGMTTLRIHLDDCDDDNAPLLIALGSHRQGLVPADQAADRAAAHPRFTCHARAGDVWAYSTPILHASERSKGERRRRVLQVDYAATALPGDLEWLGLA